MKAKPPKRHRRKNGYNTEPLDLIEVDGYVGIAMHKDDDCEAFNNMLALPDDMQLQIDCDNLRRIDVLLTAKELMACLRHLMEEGDPPQELIDFCKEHSTGYDCVPKLHKLIQQEGWQAMNRLKPTKGTKLYHRGKQEIVTVIEVEYKYDPCGFVIQTKEGFNFVLMTYNSTWIWDYITTE